MESEGRNLLMRSLDDSLRRHAKELGEGDGLPQIVKIYELQLMAEVHVYLKTEHPFTPKEVNTLLEFADPLEVATACWEENPDLYAFDICAIIEDRDIRQSFPPAEREPDRPEKRSLKERLRDAQRESRRQARQETPEHPGNKGRGESL